MGGVIPSRPTRTTVACHVPSACFSQLALQSIPGRWCWMHRAKYSATCQTSRPGRRRWPSRARSWSRRGCTPDRGLFVAEERGSHELKGVPEPVTLFRLVRASGGGRRSGQRHLTPLVGRDVAAQRQRSRDHQRARGGGPRHPPILGEDDFEGPSRRRGSRMTRPYAALEALGAIGGPEASRSVSQMIVKGIVQGPNLAAAATAASRLRVVLPPDVALPLLRHANPSATCKPIGTRGGVRLRSRGRRYRGDTDRIAYRS